jgi:hypothetical protein
VISVQVITDVVWVLSFKSACRPFTECLFLPVIGTITCKANHSMTRGIDTGGSSFVIVVIADVQFQPFGLTLIVQHSRLVGLGVELQLRLNERESSDFCREILFGSVLHSLMMADSRFDPIDPL